MKYLKALLSVILTVCFICLLEIKIGHVPPLGRFLSPGEGFWQNAEGKNTDVSQTLNLEGLKSNVVIKYDENRIPHIFANNDHDLYYAQGYVTANQRLWQIDIQTRSAAGRLAEVVGPEALSFDRYHRRMGMVFAAENSLREMMSDPKVREMILAYTAGINSYIHSLRSRDYPLEYKLLDYRPEDFKPIDCAFLIKLMSETLAGSSNEFAMSNILRKFGARVTTDLFPDANDKKEPIIPTGTRWPFKPSAIPEVSGRFKAMMRDSVATVVKDEGIGSNNWAVSGNKTISGYPILANDPHLNLTYPSIWFQVQLSAPGINVCGVSLPGAPGVVLGFNENVSWGITNVDADVLDWYEIRFKDKGRTEYLYNNKWHKAVRRMEVINVRGQKPLVDTVIYTVQGPVVYEDKRKQDASTPRQVPVGDALRWIAHDASDELKAIYLLNRSKNYDDYRHALTYFNAPASNFVFASKTDIAITTNGKFPLKYRDQGKFILDGTDPDDDWHGWIPFEQVPSIKNPARGFVSSANQSPTDKTYPYYLNWKFEPYERGKRINDKLASMQNITVDSMRMLQNDIYSIRANDALPLLLRYLDTTKLNALESLAYHELRKWDMNYSTGSAAAPVFSAWWLKTNDLIWQDDFSGKAFQNNYPSFDRTERLIEKEPGSGWFDDKRTVHKETCSEIINAAYRISIREISKRFGPSIDSWKWGMVRKIKINHLTNQEALGSGPFGSPGYNSTINAIAASHGPSWRMVVQMGSTVKGYGILPGGESGNPGSRYYDNMLETWQKGELQEILFLKSAAEGSPRIQSTLLLTTKK